MFKNNKGVKFMKKAGKLIIASSLISVFSATPVFAVENNFNNYNNYSSPASSYTFPTAPSSSYHDALASSQAYISAPSGAPQLTGLPDSIGSMYISPETTQYNCVSYDKYLGTIYRTTSQRGDILDEVKNFNLSNMGINRTISEVLGALTPNYDGVNSACGWYKDSNNANSVICTCGIYTIYFDCFASSTGMDIYASIGTQGQGIHTFTENEITNFFKNLDVQLTNIENVQKESTESSDSGYSQYYNNSIVINGTNSGTIIYNNK